MTGKTPKKKARKGVDRAGRTALHQAAVDGKLALAKRLLSRGADANATDDNGWTPLHFAAKYQHLAVVGLLLDAGCSVDVRDQNGNTPLMEAVFEYAEDGAIIESLRRHGANPKLENRYGVSPWSLSSDLDDPEMMRRLRGLLRGGERLRRNQ